MMSRSNVKLYVILGAMAVCFVAMAPQAASAQATGVGGDGYTSLLWKGADSSIVVWRLDPTLGSVTANRSYGPYLGYTPVALTTDIANYTHVLWRYTDGAIALWSLDPGLNFAGNVFFGPYFGWTATSLSADPTNGSVRVLWKRTDGAVAIFAIGPTGVLGYEGIYGPYAGYEPAATSIGPRALRSAAKMPSIDTSSVEKSKKAAAAAMRRHHK